MGTFTWPPAGTSTRPLTDFTALSPEPDLIKDALTQHVIYKTKGLDHWSHPAFESAMPPAQRELAIGRSAAGEGLVPLWGLLNAGAQSSLRHALNEIAEARRKELIAEFSDGKAVLESFSGLLAPGESWSDVDSVTLEVRLRDRRAEWVQNVMALITGMRDFKLSTIELTGDELPKAIAIFEAINRGGTPLSAFDLVTARYARAQSGKSLPEMIQSAVEGFPQAVPFEIAPAASGKNWLASGYVALIDGALTTAFKTQFLQVLVMHKLSQDADGVHHFTVDEIKQQKVLSLSASDVDANWETACCAVLEAWRFLQVRCGVKDEGALRNKLLILPLAVALSSSEILKNAATYNRLEYWYWCSVLSATYTNRQNENSVADTNLLCEWLRDPQGKKLPVKNTCLLMKGIPIKSACCDRARIRELAPTWARICYRQYLPWEGRTYFRRGFSTFSRTVCRITTLFLWQQQQTLASRLQRLGREDPRLQECLIAR